MNGEEKSIQCPLAPSGAARHLPMNGEEKSIQCPLALPALRATSP